MEINQANIWLHIADAITDGRNAVKDLRVQTAMLRDLQQLRDSAAREGLINAVKDYNLEIDRSMAKGADLFDIAEKAGETLQVLILVQETFFNDERDYVD